jgi:hypothetical protein
MLQELERVHDDLLKDLLMIGNEDFKGIKFI